MTPNNRTMRTASGNGGFTLIELMMTVCLAAILFAVAVPSFRTVMANNRLVTQTNDLVGALQIARSEAITRNRPMTLCRTTAAAETTCAGGTSVTTWDNWSVLNAGVLVRSGAIPTYGGAIKVTSTMTNNTVVFSSDGLARNGTSTGALLGAAEQIGVCTNTISTLNMRAITPGSGSRLSTTKATGTC